MPQKFAVPCTLTLALSLTGCFGWPSDYSVDGDGETFNPPQVDAVAPVYMTYEQLRQPVAFRQDVPLKNFGKIYVYEQYLFVNSRNAGIYLFDNSDPQQPRLLGFLDIPGNLDLAVKGGVLYADSYVDMVAVDLREPSAPKEIARFTNVFPYDPRQNIGASVRLGQVDERNGVVVGNE